MASRGNEPAIHRPVLFLLSWAGACAAGAALRLYRLAPQVLVGDELHAVRAVSHRQFPQILVTYGVTDVCLPLVGLARWLSERGVVLAEGVFRTPVVVAGLLLLALFPWLARRAAAPAAALLFPWWLALSPQLVLYGRIARSYTPATLFAGLAAAAFFAWWRTRRAAWAAAYAGLGALAVWFHLLSAVFVAAPLAFAGIARVAAALRRPRGGEADRTRERPGWLALAVVGLALAAGVALFLVPGWDGLAEMLGGKRGRGEVQPGAVADAARLLAGTVHPLLAGLFWAAAAAGFVRLLRRDRELALYSALLVGAHAAALAVAQPYGLANPLVLGRYLLLVLPVVLLWVAHGLDWRGRRWTRLAGLAAGAALLVSIVATGPFAAPRLRYSSFLHHEDFLAFHRPLPKLPEERIPRFYRRLAREAVGEGGAGGGAILELPSFPEGENRALHRYQDLHRREVLLTVTDPALNDPRFDFRNRVRLDPAAVLASRARYLVVHRDLGAEERAVELPPGVPNVWGARQRNLSRHFRQVAIGFPRRAAPLLGAPDESYARLLVWDLDRVRRRGPLPVRRVAPGAASGR